MCEYSCYFQVIESICRVHYVWPSDEVKTAFGIGIMFVQFFIPFAVLVICYDKNSVDADKKNKY